MEGLRKQGQERGEETMKRLDKETRQEAGEGLRNNGSLFCKSCNFLFSLPIKIWWRDLS
jgi:hypothetical protein